MNDQVEGSLTLDFKVLHQGHVTHFHILKFELCWTRHQQDNIFASSHLTITKQRILTTVVDIRRHDIWRQDDVIYAKMCLT